MVRQLREFSGGVSSAPGFLAMTVLAERQRGTSSGRRCSRRISGLKMMVSGRRYHRLISSSLLNILLNSLEAMQRGGRLEVAILPSAKQVRLRVTDTGCGISPEHQLHVWDPFFTTKERGMGLGLAIVKGVIERHGGRIAISSRPGKGTTVELFLPVTAS